MTFDSDISETVSLSKVLDSLLEDGEEPNIICTFLSQHESYLKDIINHSLLSNRIFQLDFINRLSFLNKSFIYKIIKREMVDKNVATILIWQIFQSNIDETTKNMFRPYVRIHKLPKHPYSGLNGKIISKFDCIFSDVRHTLDYYIYYINHMEDSEFQNYALSIDSSLWLGRMLQLDFFLNLTPQKQYIFIKSINSKCSLIDNYHENSLMKFFRQILVSNIDIGIKEEVYFKSDLGNFSFNYDIDFLGSETLKEILELKTFPELMLKMNIIGIDYIAPDVIFWLLINRRLNMLFEWMEYDRESLEQNFDICDLLERLKNDR